MNSLRHRLLLWISLSLVVMFLISGLVLFAYVQYELGLHFDSVLLERASILARTTEQLADGTLYFEFLEAELKQHYSADSGEYYQVWTRRGESVGRSPSLGEESLPVRLPLYQDPVFQSIRLPDGRNGRLVALSFLPHEEEAPAVDTFVMAFAVPLTELETIISRLLQGLLFSGLALLLGLFPGIWLSVNRSLESLDLLSSQTSTIRTDDLSFRFPASEMPQELRPISLRLNDLLDRLQAAFERERRFTGDAAHELRTPIAELKILAEVGLAEAVSEMPSFRSYFEDALAIARHMESLVSLLLSLSRCQSGQQVLEKVHCSSIGALLKEVCQRYQGEAEERRLSLELAMEEDFSAESDPVLLAAVFENLLSNAVVYTPAGGRIRLAVRNAGGIREILIGNAVSGVTLLDVSRFTEPFWRKNQTFSATAHAGLGLALVSAYARLLQIELAFSLPEPGWLQCTLRF